ncbi:MAG: hypothetical protein BWY94_02375 [Actinobacteria bacterium ADurb.BinA094]|nr:MAG: hypothetical protein BWY94_02375 [Actinobacteria bacterium ADurb.BinA094]
MGQYRPCAAAERAPDDLHAIARRTTRAEHLAALEAARAAGLTRATHA